MASIESNLETIRTSVYGKDMRQAIYESIKKLNTSSGTSGTSSSVSDIDVEEIVSSIENAQQSIQQTVANKVGGDSSSTVSSLINSSATNVNQNTVSCKEEILSAIDAGLEPIKENLSVLAESSVNSGIVQHGFVQIKGNGLTIINNFDLSNCTSFEYCCCVRFTTAPYPSVVYSLFGSKLTHYALPSLEIGREGIIARISDNGQNWNNYQDEWAINWSDYLNSFLFLKLKYADGKAAIYSSTDGVNFTARTTPTSCAPPYAGGNDFNKLLIGGGGETADHAFTIFSDTEGINIFNCYVRLNGNVIWGRRIAGEIID